MPISNVLEPKQLDQLLGPLVATVNQTISAGTAAQTAITIQGSIGSGNADHTPVVGEIWVIATPGAAGTENQLSNFDVFQVSGSPTATSLTFGSRTVVAARAVGDWCFVLNTTTGLSAFGNHPLNGKVFVGLSTAGAQATIAAGSDTNTLPQGTINITQSAGAAAGSFPASGNVLIFTESGAQEVAYTGLTGTNPNVTALTGCTGGTGTIDTGDVVILVPTAATILAAEPTSAGGYTRQSVLNNAAQWAAATGSYPASKQNANAVNWTASTAAYSSAGTPLLIGFVADNSTLAGGNVLFWGYNSPAQTVNNSGITPQIAAGILKLLQL